MLNNIGESSGGSINKQTLKDPLLPREFWVRFDEVSVASRAKQKPNGSIEPQRMEPRDCGSAGGVFQKKKKNRIEKSE